MIKDIQTFRALIPTVTGKNLDKYRQPLLDAQAWFASKITGSDLMAEMEKGQDEEPLPRLFLLGRLVVAYKAYLIAIPQMDVIETDNGFAVVNDQTFAPASRDRVAALNASTSENLAFALAQFIEYVEDQEELHALWVQSPAFDAMSGSYFQTLRVLHQYCSPLQGYLDFIDAAPVFRSIIGKEIAPVISAELSAEVLSQLQNGELSESNKSILGDLRWALAGYYTGDRQLGDMFTCNIRERLESDPADFPAFERSVLYRKIREAAAREKPTENSILSLI